MKNLELILKGIKPTNEEAKAIAKERLDHLIKPLGSLGKLEDIAIQLSGITGKLYNKIDKKALVLMSSDNGVLEEGVSPVPQIITAEQTINFLNNLGGISVLTNHASMDLKVVDIGIASDVFHPKLINRKIRKGTSNMAKGPAMGREEAIKAINIGIEMVENLVKENYQIVGTGEMGIGNTSTSSAILMAFSGCSSEVAVGKGAGLTEEGYYNKKIVIEKALELNKPDKNDPIDVLAKVGGFDIAGLVGVYLGAAFYRIPVIIDGFISAAAALTAYKLNPLTREYMIPSHNSAELGFKLMMEELELSPILNLDMRLGEGTGCPLVFNIIEAATKIIKGMATFEEVQMNTEKFVDIRESKK